MCTALKSVFSIICEILDLVKSFNTCLIVTISHRWYPFEKDFLDMIFRCLICKMYMYRFEVLDEEPGDEDEGGGQR